MRSEVYTLTEYKNSGLSGTVTFFETDDPDKILIEVNASGLVADTSVKYLNHLHSGTVDSLTGTIITFPQLSTATGSVTKSVYWNVSYENAIISNTCYTIHDPAHFANDSTGYHLAGNTGKNAK